MTIKELHSLNLANITKKPRPVANEREASVQVKKIIQEDLVEISKETKELQDSDDIIKIAKALLTNLPSVRAHVVYDALAKLKVGTYSSDNILSEAASKLLTNK
jgi:hypothetical protein